MPPPPPKNATRIRLYREGYALLDTLLALTIGSIMSISLVMTASDIQARYRAIDLASAINDTQSAARNYMDRNYQTLLSLVPVNQTIAIPLSGNENWNGIGDIVSSSALPDGWTGRLPNGQKLNFLMRHVPLSSKSPEHLAALLVSSDGNPLTDRQVGIAMSALRSGMAGGIMKRGHGATAGSIQGLSGAWSAQLQDWSEAAPLTYGHVALYLSSDQTIAPYLNRYNIGNGEPNRLHTSVDVNSNDLNNIRALTGVNTMRFTGATGAVNAHGGINLCVDNVYGCGLSVSDNGGIYDLNDYWLTVRMANPNFGLHVEGNLKVDRTIATNGYSNTSGYPSGWGGGLHTLDVYAEGGSVGTGLGGALSTLQAHTGFFTSANGNINDETGDTSGDISAYMRTNGDIYSATSVTSSVFRPSLVVNAGDVCGNSVYNSNNRTTLNTQNGDIARDSEGHTLSCVSGQWQRQGGFNRILFSDNRWTWTNNTGSPVFVVFSGEYNGGKKDAPDWRVYMNGPSQNTVQLCHVYNNSTANYVSGGGSCDAMVPSGFTIWKSGNAGPAMTGIGP